MDADALGLWPAFAALLAVSLAAFAATARLTRAAQGRTRLAVLAAIVAALILFVAFLYDRLTLARLLPRSNVIVLGNAIPPLAAAIVGLLWSAPGIGRLRKFLLVAALLLATLRVVSAPWVGRPPVCGDRWEKGVCMQTTTASCGAAAAATLLSRCGVGASEAEMVDLCLTRNGTSRLGLYRGLRLKTRGTPWQVEVFSGDVAGLRRRVAGGPVILFVGLRRGQRADPRYARDWGWTPGLRHAVVLFGFKEGGFIDIGDPTMGREKWRVEALDVLWDGQAVQLVRR
jgi:hypothetical protein